MKRTYDFATIGFRPYTETEEFVTIGVVALDTAARHFGFALLDARKTARVRPMFPATVALYKEARQRLEAELTAIQRVVNGQGPGAEVPLFPEFREGKDGLFAAITNPREGVLCYPVKGRRMADGMEEVLEALRARFIDQNQLTPQQAVENQMATDLRKVLRAAKLLPAFEKDVKIGPEEFHVTFTLAHMAGEGRADRALRPLNFDLPTPTEIFNHGDTWINRLRRLQRNGFRPDRCLFTTRAPKDADSLKQKAFAEIRKELLIDEIEMVAEDDAGKIIEFARFPESVDLKLAR
jgi:Protein of unknown function (DUF3037)